MVESNFKISVIIPVYNTEKYLKKCLDSVIKQTYSNIEIIIINDSSIDNSINILRNYENKNNVIIINLLKNVGIGAIRNIGIKQSTGEYITFIDSDDWIEIDYLEKNLSYFNLDNSIDIVCTGLKLVDPDNNIIRIDSSKNDLLISKKESMYYLFSDSLIKAYIPGKFYKKKLFNGITFKENRYFEDTASTHLIFQNASKIYLNTFSLYNYLKRNDSITGQSDLNKNYIAKRDFYLSLHERVQFCLNFYSNEKLLISETCNRAIYSGFDYIYFSIYHNFIDNEIINKICENLINYPFKKSNMISIKTKFLYLILLFNKTFFLKIVQFLIKIK